MGDDQAGATELSRIAEDFSHGKVITARSGWVSGDVDAAAVLIHVRHVEPVVTFVHNRGKESLGGGRAVQADGSFGTLEHEGSVRRWLWRAQRNWLRIGGKL